MNATLSKTTAAKSRFDQARRRSRPWRKLIPYVVVAGLIVALVAGIWPKPLSVEIAGVNRGPLTVSVLEEGKTRIRHRYVISPPIAGFLTRIDLRPGARIERGKTVLATIEPEMSGFLDARTLAETDARLKSAQATQQQRQAQVDQGVAALDLANKDLGRMDSLHRTGAIAPQDWDAAQNRVQMRERELHAAQFGLQVADFDVAQAKAALTQAQAPKVDSSQPLVLVAPVDGYVLNVYEENARVVTAGQQLMEVGDPEDLEAEIELLTSDAVAVRPGAQAFIEHWGGSKPLRAQVSLVEPGAYTKVSALGVEEQRVKVRVEFLESPPAGMELGDRYRVEARIVVWQNDNVLQIPTAALFRRGNDWMTFVVQGGKARLQKVEIGHNSGTAAEVRAGLSAGDKVIVHPSDAVRDGSSVAILH
ncbi:MAG: efflux RND transporter periplasmic adaptor subunit [Verrucomicrobia bacterium]|nr:efflux RND transporter periplasmic adaptor subunit [Verrucomicrobiota bacterium]